MKSINGKLTLVLLMLLITLGSLTMVTGCKKKSGAEKPAERSTSVEQQEEDLDDEAMDFEEDSDDEVMDPEEDL